MNVDVRSALKNTALTCKKCEGTGFADKFLNEQGEVITAWAIRCQHEKVLCACQRIIYETYGEPTDDETQIKRERYNRAA